MISGWGEHNEGVALDAESGNITAVLSALGFDPNAWLDEGQVYRVTWTMLDPEQQADAHKRLHFGQLRMRIDHIQQAAAEAIRAGYDGWTVEK